jgi:hypothetical protein
MVNMYSIRKQFYAALGLFSFFGLCGFLFAPSLSNSQETIFSQRHLTPPTKINFTVTGTNPIPKINNGSIELVITEGKAPYKILVYSTNMPLKEYQVTGTLLIPNLGAGDYMIVVSGGDNAYSSKTITLRQE